MDTKSKGNKNLGMVVSLLLVAIIAAVHLGISVPLYEQGRNEVQAVNVYEGGEFQATMLNGFMGAYWKLHQTTDSRPTPYELYFDEGMDATLQEYFAYTYSYDSEDSQNHVDEFRNAFNQSVIQQEDSFANSWGHYRFYLQDAAGELVYTNEAHSLADILSGKASQDSLSQAYEYFIVLDFNEGGDMSVRQMHGADMQSANIEDYFTYTLRHTNGIDEELIDQFYSQFYSYINLPSDFSMVLAVPQGMGSSYEIGSLRSYLNYYSNDDLMLVFILALGAALLAGLLLSRVKRLQLGSYLLARIPLEVCVFIIGILFASSTSFAMGGMFTFTETNGLDVGNLHIPELALIGCMWALETLELLVAYFAAVSLAQVFDMGLRQYLHERSWIVRAWHWLGRKARQFYAWATDIDLTNKTNRDILRFVLINAVVVSLLCVIWVAGILGVVIYSAVLFHLLKKLYDDIKAKYGVLLAATSNMAHGELDMDINDDLGPFNPLKDNLSRIREGFSTAVENETRSQNMRTELITNVSHDLKTPLTAIITYVDLLKNESIDDAQRREYVGVLDKKSQRLKRLIEDLFEMSKAASGNVSISYDSVDLPALIKQVESENRDVLDEAGINLVYRINSENHALQLDGEKTSRIFENLLHNVAKYSVSGTRAFVEMHESGGRLVTSVKNISRDPLDFDTDQITERFIRGDKARNTDGSGLGLAIAKSFTELQGGEFHIEADADLFKAVVEFHTAL